jgi:ATP-dependent Lon protease
LPWIPSSTGSVAVTRSDFLANAKAQLDADHFGLDKVKRRTIEYLAVVRLRALIAQEAEAEQAKVHEVALKNTSEDPAADAGAGDNQKEKENAYKALIKAGEMPPPQMRPNPASPPSTEVRASHKAIKAPILLYVAIFLV